MALLIAASCAKKVEPTISEDFNMSGIILPYEIERLAGGTVELKVLGNHGPSATDEVQFTGSVTCRMPIKEASSTLFSFDLNPDLFSGDYKMSIVRDGRVRNVGNTRLLISTAAPIDPQDATVYGEVAANGQGIPGVVVSDGVEVTQTDGNGIYRLKSQKTRGYVFISVPSGYEPFADRLHPALPCIHKRLQKAENKAERVDFSLIPVEGQDNATILVLGDMHLASRHNDLNQFKDFIDDINEYTSTHPGKIYGLSLGDMTWDQFWKVNQFSFPEYLKEINPIKNLMIYHTIGNHDHSMYEIGDVLTVRDYEQNIAPTYYSFNVGKVHFIVLDDVQCYNNEKDEDSKGNPCYKRDYYQNIVDGILEWLKKDLKYVPKTTPLVLTMHTPLYNNDATGTYRLANNFNYESAKALENAVKGYKEAHFFTAHTHKIYNQDKLSEKNIFEHNSGAICATWWASGYKTPGIHIGQDGSQGGYMVLNLEGTSMKWQYKSTGFPISHQFRTYDRNNIWITADKYAPSANEEVKKKMMEEIAVYDGSERIYFTKFWKEENHNNEVYINVWNYDRSWKVEVTENGKSLSVTLDREAFDPLHIIAYEAKYFNDNTVPTNFTTATTSHIFKCKASSPTSTLEIKVTDRFGNVYTETMERPKPFDIETYKK